MALGLMRFVREGFTRKLLGRDEGDGRILVLENSELGFELGPLLARVLRIPHFYLKDSTLPRGRAVISAVDTTKDKIAHQYLIDLHGNFGEHLLEEMTRGVDVPMEALKQAMQLLIYLKGHTS